MSVIYRVKTPSGGEPVEMNAYQIVQQANAALQGTDKQILAVTPDGLTAQVSQAGKQYTVPMQSLLRAAGMTVESALPPSDSVDFSLINPAWRYAISNLEDDAQRKAYIQAKVQELKPNAEIVGSGRDWFFWDAESGKWQGLTNSPDLDMADLGEVGTTGARIAGGILGGIGGGAAGTAVAPGVGTTAGMMAGSAAGTAGAEALTRGIAAIDPAYRQVFDAGKATQAGLTSAAISGVAPGVVKGIGALGSKVLNPTLQSAAAAPISTVGNVAGKITEGVGNVAQAAQIGATGVGKMAGSILTPGLQTATTAGVVMQSPSLLVRGLGWLARGGKGAASAEEVLGGAGAAGGRFMGRMGARPAFGEGAEEAARRAGYSNVGDYQRAVATAKMAQESAGRGYGETVGRGVDALQRGGEKMVKGAEELFGMGARGAAAVGRGMSAVGGAMQTGARAITPYETQALGQVGARAATPTSLQSYDLPAAPGGLQIRSPYEMRPPIPVNTQQYNPYAIVPTGGAPAGGYPAGYLPYDLEI